MNWKAQYIARLMHIWIKSTWILYKSDFQILLVFPSSLIGDTVNLKIFGVCYLDKD